MPDAAIVLLVIFTIIASVDGLWIHLRVYRLHERLETRREHLLHTVNAVLFPITIALLFLSRASGAWLWIAVLVHLAVLGVELVDVLIEPDSRRPIGGLTGVEASLHFLMAGLRAGYVAIGFASIPAARWSAGSELVWLSPLDGWQLFVPWAVALVGVPVAILHVVLAGGDRRAVPILVR